ncbi:nuclear transport factor 2 family protein [Jiella avicenniae]|uniref:Nuclear transport factor 2 family protein n=1 Tax=Jiella avicenniae TaxID=2907202 RepID=A0A9X1P4L7_9HYPH|nr:nuclear transport factor 2 family protein [Jiella avicenniae]MCE7030353.1 nuclear transport factor 2 family protein [Jiella avicenniae]
MADETPPGQSLGFKLAVESLFRAYAEGFDDFDLRRVIDCFAYPVTIWQSGKGTVFADADDLAENVEALFDVFESEEIAHSDFKVLEAQSSGNAAFVTLAWRQERGDGEVQMEFRCRYALRRNDLSGHWLIALVINEEEVALQ